MFELKALCVLLYFRFCCQQRKIKGQLMQLKLDESSPRCQPPMTCLHACVWLHADILKIRFPIYTERLEEAQTNTTCLLQRQLPRMMTAAPHSPEGFHHSIRWWKAFRDSSEMSTLTIQVASYRSLSDSKTAASVYQDRRRETFQLEMESPRLLTTFPWLLNCGGNISGDAFSTYSSHHRLRPLFAFPLENKQLTDLLTRVHRLLPLAGTHWDPLVVVNPPSVSR